MTVIMKSAWIGWLFKAFFYCPKSAFSKKPGHFDIWCFSDFFACASSHKLKKNLCRFIDATFPHASHIMRFFRSLIGVLIGHRSHAPHHDLWRDWHSIDQQPNGFNIKAWKVENRGLEALRWVHLTRRPNAAHFTLPRRRTPELNWRWQTTIPRISEADVVWDLKLPFKYGL